MAILIFILILSFLVIIHELGHFFIARWSGITVKEFGVGYPPKATKLFTWQGTDFTFNWIPFGGFVRMAGDEVTPDNRDKVKKGDFYAATKWRRLFVVLAGATVNFLFGILAFAIIFSIVGIPIDIPGARIGEITADSPAAMVSVPTNVNITAFEYEGEKVEVTSFADVIDYVSLHRGDTVDMFTTGTCQLLECEPTEKSYQIYVRTEAETPINEGSIGVVHQQFEMQFYPWYLQPLKAAQFGLDQALLMGREILMALSRLGTNLVSKGQLSEELAGPVGIVHQAQNLGIFDQGILTILSFAGMLSINLAIMNVLPIPPLDGGKAIFTVFETVVNPKKLFKIEYWMSYSGYILLLGLVVIITARDIMRIFS